MVETHYMPYVGGLVRLKRSEQKWLTSLEKCILDFFKHAPPHAWDFMASGLSHASNFFFHFQGLYPHAWHFLPDKAYNLITTH